MFLPFVVEVFYSTQYDRLENDSYVIEKDKYVRIRRLRLILYDWFVYGSIQRLYGSIRVLSKM
jgi:hypothetical protein